MSDFDETLLLFPLTFRDSAKWECDCDSDPTKPNIDFNEISHTGTKCRSSSMGKIA